VANTLPLACVDAATRQETEVPRDLPISARSSPETVVVVDDT
jgi:hypothetical protein